MLYSTIEKIAVFFLNYNIAIIYITIEDTRQNNKRYNRRYFWNLLLCFFL